MTLSILVPVNRLSQAKGRLATHLSDGTRRELALATLDTVLDACTEYCSRSGARTWVLTADELVAASVPEAVRVVREDHRLRGLNEQIEAALAQLVTSAVLILHADLPLLTSQALAEFVEGAPAAPSAAIAASGDGGTNAMLLCPPGRFALAYGRGSAAKHQAAAEAAGLRVAVTMHPAISLDLDTPEDLTKLMQADGGRESRAGRVIAESWG